MADRQARAQALSQSDGGIGIFIDSRTYLPPTLFGRRLVFTTAVDQVLANPITSEYHGTVTAFELTAVSHPALGPSQNQSSKTVFFSTFTRAMAHSGRSSSDSLRKPKASFSPVALGPKSTPDVRS